MKPTVVLGATTNPYRYSFLAVHSLLNKKHEVYPVGIRKGSVAGVEIINSTDYIPDIHTITLYLGKENQKKYYDFILNLSPKRVIFNPGTYNQELIELLEKKGIEISTACTLVLLQNGMY